MTGIVAVEGDSKGGGSPWTRAEIGALAGPAAGGKIFVRPRPSGQLEAVYEGPAPIDPAKWPSAAGPAPDWLEDEPTPGG